MSSQAEAGSMALRQPVEDFTSLGVPRSAMTIGVALPILLAANYWASVFLAWINRAEGS
jgi:hypothetical protein